jgi:hypothetical protein
VVDAHLLRNQDSKDTSPGVQLDTDNSLIVGRAGGVPDFYRPLDGVLAYGWHWINSVICGLLVPSHIANLRPFLSRQFGLRAAGENNLENTTLKIAICNALHQSATQSPAVARLLSGHLPPSSPVPRYSL